jgi:CheY-like chemotaxis protein
MNLLHSVNSKPLNILLVDDDDGDARAVTRAFEKAKIANPILRAVDGVEALEVLKGSNGKEKAPSPILLLVDISMPRMNGIEFIKALRADTKLHASIVFVLTTSKEDEDKVAAYALNVAGYIFKESAGHDFLHLIELMDCYWRVVELP